MTNPNHPARTDFVRASDSPSRPAPHSSDLVRLGIDIGSVNVKVVLQTPAGHHALTRPAKGRPLSTLLSMLEALELQEQQLVAVTGGGHMLISEPLDLYHVTEVVAAACSAADNQSAGEPIRTVIDLGGQLSRWILLAGPSDHEEPGTVIDFATNGLCAAGSGAFLEQQAARLQLPVDALGKHAADAARGATIAGRCSVFAKSDMIHLQQKGTPVDEMAYGLCQALVRTFLSTVAAGRDLEGPVLLAGGGAKNPGIQRAFVELSRLSDDDFVVADAPEQLAAQGAAKLARSRVDRDDFIDELRKLERSQSASKTPSDEPAQKTRLVPLEKTMPPDPRSG